ncbi:MAG: hypothetical protein WBD09_06105 [Halobacteriota archaeon]
MKAKKSDNKDVNRAMQYDRSGEFVDGNKSKLQIAFFNKLFFKRLFSLSLITAIIFFCVVTIASANEAANVTAPISKIMDNGAGWILGLIGIVAVALIAPVLIVMVLLRKNLQNEYALGLPKHSVRALLAFSLIVLIAILLILFVSVSEITTALLAILASIVAFYFGQRSAEPKT